MHTANVANGDHDEGEGGVGCLAAPAAALRFEIRSVLRKCRRGNLCLIVASAVTNLHIAEYTSGLAVK